MNIARARRSTDSEREHWIIVKNLSIEGLVALVVALSGCIYTVAVVQADTRNNSRDIEYQKQWVLTHVTEDRTHDSKLEERLLRIEEKLDILVGESHSKGR